MAPRIPKAELSTQMSENMIKQPGAVPELVEVLWHSPKAALANLEFSARVGARDAAGASLKPFAQTDVAAQVGCSWCPDIGCFQALNQNLDMARASQVPSWREPEGFSAACEIPLARRPEKPGVASAA